MESQRGVDKEKKVMKGIIVVGVKEKERRRKRIPVPFLSPIATEGRKDDLQE
jgi:hypothetical protein